MLVDLQQVSAEGRAIDNAVNLPENGAERQEFRLVTPVRVIGHISRKDLAEDRNARAFRLLGRIVADHLELACDRCLVLFETEVREDLDLLFLPQSNNVALAGEDDRGLGQNELSVSFYRDDQIDLSHVVWEQIVLAIPMKPLCKLDCKGLCPDCGVNRNVASCSCVRDDMDPRWKVLKDLLDL